MGAKNKRTVAVEAAMQTVAERFKADMPAAFDGDGVAYLQTVYKDPHQPTELRMDAASKAARYGRPALAATLTRDVTPIPSTRQETDARIRELLQKGLSHAAAITIDATAADGCIAGAERE